MPKPSTSLRLSDEARKLLAVSAERLSISQTAVLELAIREFAEKRHIAVVTPTPTDQQP